MKKVRVAVFSLMAVLIAAVLFYLDNKEVNALKNHQVYPMVSEPTQHPEPITVSTHEIGETKIHLTKLYSRNDAKGLYLGMWYGDRNAVMKNNEEDWLREKGHIEFLVKAVDSNGTTYNGSTIGTTEGTFTTFRYIQFDDFRYNQELDTLDLAFYPMMDDGKGGVPFEHPWLETTVEVE
ncbi:hypothetical protein ACQ4XT_20285 [Halobacillus faecis]